MQEHRFLSSQVAAPSTSHVSFNQFIEDNNEKNAIKLITTFKTKNQEKCFLRKNELISNI